MAPKILGECEGARTQSMCKGMYKDAIPIVVKKVPYGVKVLGTKIGTLVAT